MKAKQYTLWDKHELERTDAQTMFRFDRRYAANDIQYVIGVDEAGRGCLAGPLFAAAVVLSSPDGLEGVDDSKRLTPERRTELAGRIREAALAWQIVTIDEKTIDQNGIEQANRKLFTTAIQAVFHSAPECTDQNSVALIDGIRPALQCPCEQHTIKAGDQYSLAIAAASILAKTARDTYCTDVMHKQYPQYGFDRHKGYATKAHYEAIKTYGPSPMHRTSYKLHRP